MRFWLERLLSRGLHKTALAALAAVIIAQLLGLVATGDRVMLQFEYSMRGERSSKHDVLVIAIDEEAIAVLGMPPWPQGTLERILESVLADAPRAIVGLDPTERLAVSYSPSANRLEHAPEQLLLSGKDVAPPQLAVGSNSVTVVPFVGKDGQRTSTGRAARLLGFEDKALDVNFVSGAGVPTMSAAHVVGGLLPPGIFRNRVVGIGVVAQPLAGLVPTPIGPLAPATIQAEALASAADGASWMIFPGWLGAFLFSLAAALAARHLRAPWPILAAVGSVLVIEFICFGNGVRLGATTPLIALGAAVAFERKRHRRATRRRLEELNVLIERMTAAPIDPGMTVDEPTFWQAVNEVARVQLGCLSWHFGELAPGERHVRVTVSMGSQPGDIQERRSAIDRPPYRAAGMSKLPVWNDNFMAPHLGVRTLLVPLEIPNQQLGFWILDFPRQVQLSEQTLWFIRGVGGQLAASLARRRGYPSDTRVHADAIDASLERSLHLLGTLQQGLPRLAEDLPVGLLVTSAFGEPRFQNDAMRRLLAASPSPMGRGVSSMVASLTGRPLAEIDGRLAGLINGEALLFSAVHATDAGVALSWMSRSSAGHGEEAMLLVTAIPGANWESDRLAQVPAAEADATWLHSVKPMPAVTSTIVMLDMDPEQQDHPFLSPSAVTELDRSLSKSTGSENGPAATKNISRRS